MSQSRIYLSEKNQRIIIDFLKNNKEELYRKLCERHPQFTLDNCIKDGFILKDIEVCAYNTLRNSVLERFPKMNSYFVDSFCCKCLDHWARQYIEEIKEQLGYFN